MAESRDFSVESTTIEPVIAVAP